MAATQTLPQVPRPGNSGKPNSPALQPPKPIPPKNHVETIVPRRGVVTLFGYGIKVYVDRGHLILEDGIGAARRRGRFSRVRHGLKRVVVIGSDGLVSLAAHRWLADQDAAFAMLDRKGKVLTVTGPVRPSDARLRRAQALANQSGTGLHIARELISRKLSAQEHVASERLYAADTAHAIREARSALGLAATIDSLRLCESQAAHAYWSAWRNTSTAFPKQDIRRVPDHWLSFGSRVSPLTHSPRLAVNPANAILNYLYAILEAETRLAVAALGLDPDFIENIDDVCIHYDGGRVAANESLIAEIGKRGLRETTKQTGLDRKTIRGIVNGKKVKTSTLVKVVVGLRDPRENKPTTLRQANKKRKKKEKRAKRKRAGMKRKRQPKDGAGKRNKANSLKGSGKLKSLKRKRQRTA